MTATKRTTLGTALLLCAASSFSACRYGDGLLVAARQDQRALRLVMTGNDAVEDFALVQVLRSQPGFVRDDGTIDVRVARKALRSTYLRRGFVDVELDAELEAAEGPAIVPDILRIDVREGPRVTISEVELEGNRSLSSAQLLEAWRGQDQGIFGAPARPLVRAEINALAKSIQATYMNAGYLLARVAEPKIERSAESDRSARARVTIRVQEGPLFSVRRFEVAPELREMLETSGSARFEGETFEARAIEGFRMQLVRELREMQYPKPDLRVTVAKVADSNAVDVMLGGDIGERRRVASIEIEGNARVSTARIRRAFAFAKGDAFVGSIEDRAVRKLMATGDFEEVDASYVEARDDSIKLLVKVRETFQAPAEPNAGYGSYERVRAQIKLNRDNVFGTGLDARAIAAVHAKGHQLAGSLVAPQIARDTSLSVGASLSRQRQPSFSDRMFAAEARARSSLTEAITAEFGYRFEDHDDSFADTAMPQNDDAEYKRGLVFAALGSDVRDHPTLPRVGHSVQLATEWSARGLGGDINAIHTSLNISKWVRVADSVHLFGRISSGAVWIQGARGRLPIQERYFIGGEDSIRSFREDQASPKDRDGEPLGGQFRNLLQLEARFALQPNIDFVVFGDAGNVGRDVKNFGLSNLRYAVGAGLHSIFANRMPIRFDAAWNPDRRAGEEEWVLHLRIGQVD